MTKWKDTASWVVHKFFQVWMQNICWDYGNSTIALNGTFPGCKQNNNFKNSQPQTKVASECLTGL